jgi:hypothetical protein
MFMLTLFWHDWIEAFGIDPDHHNGSLEWAIEASLLAVTVIFGTLAGREWVRLLHQP